MGIGDAFGIVNKVMSRFTWNKNVIRRNKIKKLEAEYEKLSKMAWSESVARKREHLRLELQKLKDEAVNE